MLLDKLTYSDHQNCLKYFTRELKKFPKGSKNPELYSRKKEAIKASFYVLYFNLPEKTIV
ncbi:MAG TPA: hypothetical protein DDW27_20715 [Bacteroidales bacterium]|nr:hypothetical protein [Bacteroidales bacterium]